MKSKTRMHERRLNSNLHLAAYEGDLLKVKALLDEGANINTLNEAGHSPFYVALRNKHSEVAEFLNEIKYPDAEYLSYDVMESIKEAIDFSDIITIKDLLFERYSEFKDDAIEYAISQGKINTQACIEGLNLKPQKIKQNQLDRLISENIDNNAFILNALLTDYNYDNNLSDLTIDGTLKYVNRIDFSDINFQNSKITDITPGQVSFRNSDLTGARISFTQVQSRQVDFSKANLTRCFIKGLYVNQALFQGTRMQDTMMDSSLEENLSPNQQLQVIDLTLAKGAAFAQNQLIKNHYLLDQAGICYGLCVELARYTLMSLEKGEGYGNFTGKLDKKLNSSSINFIYRVQSFQNKLQEISHRFYINIENINNNNFLNSLPNEIAHSDIIGCTVPATIGNHIFTITKIRNKDNIITGYKIFDPNLGEYSPKTDLEANQYVNMIFQFYQVEVKNRESYFNVIALDDLVKILGLVHPKNVPESEVYKPNKYSALSLAEITEMTLLSEKPLREHFKKVKELFSNKEALSKYINNPIMKNNNNITTNLLHMAVLANRLDSVKLLVKNGADINLFNSDGITALHCAASNGLCKMVEYLLDHGASLNIPNSLNLSPLMTAAKNNRLPSVKILLKAGEDPNLKNIYGQTAAFINPKFFTDDALITIFKEAIDDNDTKSIGNLLKHYSHLKNKIIEQPNNTLFSYALTKDSPKMTLYLLQEGFVPNGPWPDEAKEHLSIFSSEEKDALFKKFSNEPSNPLIRLLKPFLDKENSDEYLQSNKPPIISRVRHVPPLGNVSSFTEKEKNRRDKQSNGNLQHT